METISLSGSWRLMPLDEKECAECTSYFYDNVFLPYNNSNSIYTTLSLAVPVGELGRLRKLDWIIEREFDFTNDATQRSVLLSHGAKVVEINGQKAESNEITDLLKDGSNTIRLVVTSSFSSEVEILRSHDGVGYSAHLRATKNGKKWLVTTALDYQAFRRHERKVTVSLLGLQKEETITFEEERRRYTIELEIPEEKAELWCIHGDGKQIMYNARITVGDALLERNLNCDRVVFDLSGVKFMDSSGIGFLMGRYKKLKKSSAAMYLQSPDLAADKVLSVSGIYSIIPKL